jgi:hypothetical protein
MKEYMKLIAVVILTLLSSLPAFAAGPSRYAVAQLPTPVLNTPDFAAVFGGKDGRTLRTDDCGLIRAMEFVALPGTAFTIEGEIRKGKSVIYRVATADYPYPTKTGYYVDSRFVRPVTARPPERERRLPSAKEILDRMVAAKGSSYVWGGNVGEGVPQLVQYYAPASPVDPKTAQAWQLKGLDCSGLLYEATNGFTPRNTSALINYGSALPIAGKSAEAIAAMVEPLDLIVWSGHVIIVLDKERTIESRLDCGGNDGGVVIRPLAATLAGIMKTRAAADEYDTTIPSGKKPFVVRRWYPR